MPRVPEKHCKICERKSVTEEQKPTEEKPKLALVHSIRPVEAPAVDVTPSLEDAIDDSVEELRTFVNDVVNSVEGHISSPIVGACVILVHADGGVSHGHSCSHKNLLALLGALGIKTQRLQASYQRSLEE